MLCSKCGNEIPMGSDFCVKCGHKLETKVDSLQADLTKSDMKQKNNYGIISIVLGVVSFVIVLYISLGLGFGLSVAAITLGIVGLRKYAKTGSGKSLSLIGLIFGIISVIIFVVYIAQAYSAGYDFIKYYFDLYIV